MLDEVAGVAVELALRLAIEGVVHAAIGIDPGTDVAESKPVIDDPLVPGALIEYLLQAQVEEST